MPPSQAPSSAPPPRQSGGGIYIAAVILLLGAIGFLVFWKLRGNDTAANPVPPPTTATSPTNFIEPPPPPPPIVDLPAVDAGGAATRVATTGGGPCAANKCTGTTNNAITAALSARAGSARPCYERALRVNSGLQGKLTVNVRVDPQGNVCSASVIEDAIHSVEVSNCVMGMFRSAKFPPPTGGCVDARIPLSFVPRESK
jgi:outer membrane biosynthesis protein TonB